MDSMTNLVNNQMYLYEENIFLKSYVSSPFQCLLLKCILKREEREKKKDIFIKKKSMYNTETDEKRFRSFDSLHKKRVGFSLVFVGRGHVSTHLRLHT